MFALELDYLVDPAELAATKPAHLQWLQHRIDLGHIIVAGPRAAGGGIIITGDLTDQEITDLIASDPWSINDLVKYSRVEFTAAYCAPGLFPQAASEEVTLINVALTPHPTASLDALAEAVTHVSNTAAGFRGSRLLRSTQDDTIVNFARWNNEADFNAIFDDPEFTDKYGRFATTTDGSRYRLYRTERIISPNPTSLSN